MKNYQRAKALADSIDVSVSTIWRYVAAGIIPQPIRPTKRTSLFDVDAVNEALAKASNETITEAEKLEVLS